MEATKEKDLQKDDIQFFLLSLARDSSLPISDIHIEEDEPVRVNLPRGWSNISLDRKIIPADIPDEAANPLFFSGVEIKSFLGRLDSQYQDKLNALMPISRNLLITDSSEKEFRLRVNAYTINGGSKLVVTARKQMEIPQTPAELGLDPDITRACLNSHGLFLVTGPTGSGKTTTIASLLNHINNQRHGHIITIEKPIEYGLKRNKCLISQKEVGVDVQGFTEALEAAMQQRPTAIFIGEIRERDAAKAMLQAAESGHMVFATMHTSSPVGAVSKLLSFFPGEDQKTWASTIAANLTAVIGQCLVPDKDNKQRVLAAEYLVNDPQVATAIAEINLKRLAELQQPKRLNLRLLKLVTDKRITMPDAKEQSYDAVDFQEVFRKRTD